MPARTKRISNGILRLVGETLDTDSVIGHCLQNLAKFKVPASVAYLDALPRNATGKVLKRVLRDRYAADDTPAIS